MKKIIFTLVACVLALVSCDKIDNLLDTTNYQKADQTTFPKTEKDAEQLVNAAYYSMYSLYGGSIFRITLFRDMIASDDVYGHGSESSTETSAADRLLEISGEEANSPWKSYYEALLRCNFALEAISALEDDLFTGDNKNWFLGQAHFMRGFYLWIMAERWETFPLTLSSEVVNMPKASVDEIYAAIADDLKQAIELIPAKYGYSRDNNLAGRATKYAAEALMGRVWLFYTGFYKKSDMAGITKQQVISWLEDCANTSVSKFDLENDPREIWPYTNEYSSGIAYGADFDTYANHENLHWVGNHSKETIWGVHFSLTATITAFRSGSVSATRARLRTRRAILIPPDRTATLPRIPSWSRNGMRIPTTALPTSVSTVPSWPPNGRMRCILGLRTDIWNYPNSKVDPTRKWRERSSIPRSTCPWPRITTVRRRPCSRISSMR